MSRKNRPWGKPGSMSPDGSEMANAGPSIRVTTPRSPPSEALAVEVHGCDMASNATARPTSGRPRKLDHDEDRPDRTALVRGAPHRLRRHRAGRRLARRWSHQPRARRHALRERRIADEGEPRVPDDRPARPGAPRQRLVRHLPRGVVVPGDRRRLRRGARPQRHRRPGDGRAAQGSAAGRAHAARSVDRGVASLVRVARRLHPPRRGERRPARRQPRRQVRGHGAQRHRPRPVSLPRREGRLPRVHRAPIPTRARRSRSRWRAAPASRSRWWSRRTSRSSAPTGTRSWRRCSTTRSVVYEAISHEIKADLLSPRARDGVPDPVARAVRAGHGGSDGVRHARRRVPGRRRGRAGRERRHRLPPRLDRRSRRGGGRGRELLPRGLPAAGEENFSAESMVVGYERLFERSRAEKPPPGFPLRP